MANYNLLYERYENACNNVFKDEYRWKDFLQTQTNTYKYDFKDSILIYEQKTEATACASFDIWNKLGRKIKNKEKGIALLDVDNKVKYVWDVSSTVGEKETIPKLWEFQNNDSFIQNLYSDFDIINTEKDLTQNISTEIEKRINDSFEEVFSEIMIDDAEVEKIKDIYNANLIESVKYCVFKRCDIEYEPKFNDISVFRNTRLAEGFGQNVNNYSKVILKDIEKSVRRYNNEYESKRERGSGDRGERDRVRRGRTRSVNTQLGAPGRESHNTGEIRLTSQRLPKEVETVYVQQTLDDGQNSKPLQRSGGASKRAEGFDYGATGETTQETGRQGFYGDGSIQLYDKRYSGGNSAKRDSVQLNIFNVVKETKAVDEKSAVFSSSPTIEDEINDTANAVLSAYNNAVSSNYNSDITMEQNSITKSTKQDKITGFALKWGLDVNLLEKSIASYSDAQPNIVPYIEELTGSDTFEKATNKDCGNQLKHTITLTKELPSFIAEINAYEENKVGFEISKSEDYKISEIDTVSTGAKSKCKGNIEAIKLVKELDASNIAVTKKHQEVLAKYVGWGGIPQVFDEDNTKWSKEYAELKGLLTVEEYKQARSSVLNAHYTSPVVIEAMYGKLNDFGFTKGRILEPAMGIGNFFGKLPDNMKNSSLYGVELDTVTGNIAKKLYPKANIKVCGFESTHFNNNAFDVAVGNVPFGNYGVNDKDYNDKNYKIHDYFFMKSLDKVRPGGIVAFITSTGTLDKQSSAFRKELASKAELLGAIRLPNNAFYANAGTKVTTDIIFLQKREIQLENTPPWIHLGETADGIPVNNYYVKNPQMLLGKMAYGSLYGKNKDTELLPLDDADLKEQLKTVMAHIKGEIKEYPAVSEVETVKAQSVDLENVRNYSYIVYQDELVFYKNGNLEKNKITDKQAILIKELIKIRDSVRDLIKLQTDHNVSDAQIAASQNRLNILYDNFVEKNKCRITSTQCRKAFKEDSAYPLLRALEVLNDDKEFVKKAPIFYERTIVPHKPVEHCDTAYEALSISMLEKANVDIDLMVKLTGFNKEKIIADLQTEIFKDPISEKWVIADEYLSGNVREKLVTAKIAAQNDNQYNINVEALQRNQPKDLEASEIFVRLGSTWIPADDIKNFTEQLLELNYFQRKSLNIDYSPHTDVWSVSGKVKTGVLAMEKYGTHRKNACDIIEESLNLRDSRVYDTVMEDGKERRVLNQAQTTIAQEKQVIIENEFKNWIFKDQKRRERLVEYYNKNFNCIVTRKYDGSNIKLHDVNPEIKLRPHQNNAIARGLYGGNKLLAHVVGAGKSFTMAAISQEKLRLGLSRKCMFAVPKHLTEQMASEILRLYPAVNVLVATADDFSSTKRKEFCAKIATGGYTTIIIAHSQLEKIPLSKEFQQRVIQTQIDEIEMGIADLKSADSERFSIKQMEKLRKNLELKLEKLADTNAKDDVISFEELGVDDLYIDEAHEFKNLMYVTKMRNVGGLSNTSSKKAQDLFMKCSYINEISNYKGLTFATGTPISNSIAELYTMQRYLQPQDLARLRVSHFDSWVSSFAQSKTALDLNPTGQGYRMKTRLANYYNLPELMTLFSSVADIQTREMLNLPVPNLKNGKVTTIVLKPTEMQKEIVESFGKRAEKIHNRGVPAEVDNFLKITNEGRLLALDQRLINEDLEDFKDSKINVAVNNIYDIWENTKADRSTQLIFSDIGTPKENEQFDVYTDLKNKLEIKGIPKEEIAFIHSAKTDEQKAVLFSKVRKGTVRVLIGSTFKMGAGTNVQDKLIALHHLDVPWRPSDLEQREGRILRQGNTNKEVEIFRYITEGTFDSYNYQIIENKQKFISQVMTNNSPARSMEEIDDKTLNYAEIKALATGNPRIKEKMEIDVRIATLQQLKSSHNNSKYRYENAIKHLPANISSIKDKINEFKKDMELAIKTKDSEFLIELVNLGKVSKRVDAGEAIHSLKKQMFSSEHKEIGKIRGFQLFMAYDTWNNKHNLILKNNMEYSFEFSDSPKGTIARIENALDSIQKQVDKQEIVLENTIRELTIAETEVLKPFEYEEELNNSIIKVTQLNAELSLDKADEEREGVVAEITDENGDIER